MKIINGELSEQIHTIYTTLTDTPEDQISEKVIQLALQLQKGEPIPEIPIEGIIYEDFSQLDPSILQLAKNIGIFSRRTQRAILHYCMSEIGCDILSPDGFDPSDLREDDVVEEIIPVSTRIHNTRDLPLGTSLRTFYKGEYHYAIKKTQGFFFEGEEQSLDRINRKILNCENRNRNNWNHWRARTENEWTLLRDLQET